MGNVYLNEKAEKILRTAARPGQSLSGVIIEYIGLKVGHDAKSK